MGSGAFAVVIDPPVNTPLGQAFTRVVPLPSTGNTGVVKFDPVFLSLAAGNNGVNQVSITIWSQGGVQRAVGPLNIGPGRTVIGRMNVGDLSVEIGFTLPAALPIPPLTALVEYTTP